MPNDTIIDILNSISRLMSNIATEDHKEAASFARDLLATYKEAEDLINLGAYVKGSNKKIDLAIQFNDRLNKYLKQSITEKSDFRTSLDGLVSMFRS